MTEQRTELYCGVGTSDKEYNASLIEVKDGEWNIKISYGKRGSAIDQGYKLKEHTDYYSAEKQYQKLIAAKQKKGYEITYQA